MRKFDPVDLFMWCLILAMGSVSLAVAIRMMTWAIVGVLHA